MRTTDEIEKIRLHWTTDYPEVTVVDIVACLTRSCQQTLLQLFRHSRKPIESEVATAAALFFSNFYIHESPLEFHPRAVTVACVNLACKTEEFHAITLSDLVNAFPDAQELKSQVPKIEMRLLAALDYDIIVQQPSLIQLYWVDCLKNGNEDDSSYLKIYDISCELIRIWQWTDAVLFFSFPKLATGAVLRACRAIDEQVGSASEEESDSLYTKMIRIMNERHPMNDFSKLIHDIEEVAYRFGKFDKLVKDPSIESTPGFQCFHAMLEGPVSSRNDEL